QAGWLQRPYVGPVHAFENTGRVEDYSESFSLARRRTPRGSVVSDIVLRGSEMPERNTPQKTLESWKQIASYLDRSERTVRRWEANEGLPVHRREHEKQDTVFAFKHEIEAWSRLRTRCSGTPATEAEGLPHANLSSNTYLL